MIQSNTGTQGQGQTMEIAFVGGGTMAEAMIRGLLARGIAEPGTLRVGEPREERRSHLRSTYGVEVSHDNLAAIRAAGVVVLAVKPQSLAEAGEELRDGLEPGQTVVSILAGVPLESLCRAMRHRAVIRVMPNSPAQVGAGMSVWTATPEVPPQAVELTATILRALGSEVRVEREALLDMATALSGSGPAYVFTVAEALIDAGVLLGLPRETARLLVAQTLLGSARLLQERADHPAGLRDMVTSPGGTTAAGLRRLEGGGVRSAVMEAAVAAYERSLELGGGG